MTKGACTHRGDTSTHPLGFKLIRLLSSPVSQSNLCTCGRLSGCRSPDECRECSCAGRLCRCTMRSMMPAKDAPASRFGQQANAESITGQGGRSQVQDTCVATLALSWPSVPAVTAVLPLFSARKRILLVRARCGLYTVRSCTLTQSQIATCRTGSWNTSAERVRCQQGCHAALRPRCAQQIDASTHTVLT